MANLPFLHLGACSVLRPPSPAGPPDQMASNAHTPEGEADRTRWYRAPGSDRTAVATHGLSAAHWRELSLISSAARALSKASSFSPPRSHLHSTPHSALPHCVASTGTPTASQASTQNCPEGMSHRPPLLPLGCLISTGRLRPSSSQAATSSSSARVP
jgi:hypothetical protein